MTAAEAAVSPSAIQRKRIMSAEAKVDVDAGAPIDGRGRINPLASTDWLIREIQQSGLLQEFR
jgi:hypothetical protein